LDVGNQKGQHYEAAVLMNDAVEAKAERILVRELRAARQTEKTLRRWPRSEPLKWKIARAKRIETTVSLGWIARRLDLGSASNVCRKIRAYARFKSRPLFRADPFFVHIKLFRHHHVFASLLVKDASNVARGRGVRGLAASTC